MSCDVLTVTVEDFENSDRDHRSSVWSCLVATALMRQFGLKACVGVGDFSFIGMDGEMQDNLSIPPNLQNQITRWSERRKGIEFGDYLIPGLDEAVEKARRGNDY